MSQSILYSGTKNASSWALRAWLALRAAGVPFQEQVVDIRRPQRFQELAAIGRFSPPAMVPVLVVDGTVIFDSLAIMEYANDCCGSSLLPDEPLDRAQARALVAWQHSGLSNIAPRISFESAFYRLKRSLTEVEIAETARLFNWLEPLLQRSRRPYLFGALSLADCALTPTVVRLLRHDVPLDRWPLCNEWSAHVLEHPLVREWLEVADGLQPIWYDEYLMPGTRIDLHPSFPAANAEQPDARR
jgi:glutathione S-transferase